MILYFDCKVKNTILGHYLHLTHTARLPLDRLVEIIELANSRNEFAKDAVTLLLLAAKTNEYLARKPQMDLLVRRQLELAEQMRVGRFFPLESMLIKDMEQSRNYFRKFVLGVKV